MMNPSGGIFSTRMRSLASAMQTPGALEALEVLHLSSANSPPVTIRLLAKALTCGAAPSLRHLNLGYTKVTTAGVEALAAMVEARAQRPACRGLEAFPGIGRIFDGCSETASCGLLRALLPTLRELKL